MSKSIKIDRIHSQYIFHNHLIKKGIMNKLKLIKFNFSALGAGG